MVHSGVAAALDGVVLDAMLDDGNNVLYDDDDDDDDISAST